MLPIQRRCEYCNRVFTSQSHNQKYCSYTCRWSAKIEKRKSQTQFGLIAEEVAEVDPQLVVRGRDGAIMAVHHEQINNMLLNEFLKEHQTVQELKKQIAELTADLQRVSAQLEMSKPAPQTVLNNQ